jgi:GAF domain-containing protein
MTDVDAATVEQLQAELRQVRDLYAAAQADVAEAREQQTATAEVLRVIASSPTDLARVIQAIVQSASRVCRAAQINVWRCIGDELVLVAKLLEGEGPIPIGLHFTPTRHSVAGRVALDGATVHVHDILESFDEFPASRRSQTGDGYHPRTVAAFPLRHDATLGVLMVTRGEVDPFTDREIALLETFADQAVIAIENARLFDELERRNRELGEASQHKSQFLANMSHELRTPLNAIIGYSEMLQEEAEDLDAGTFLPDLRRINSAGKHLLGLINDILDLSKIESGRMELYPETFAVGRLVQDVASIIQPLVEKNGNTLVVDCPDDVGEMHADVTKVRQTLFNLLSNAAKFTDHGIIELRVTRENALTPGLLRCAARTSA